MMLPADAQALVGSSCGVLQALIAATNTARAWLPGLSQQSKAR
jgi:hypothetical protein